jgi:hypothetical protein
MVGNTWYNIGTYGVLEFRETSEFGGGTCAFNSTYATYGKPYLEIYWHSGTPTTTTTIPTTSSIRTTTTGFGYTGNLTNVSAYYGNYTTGLIGNNTGILGSPEQVGRYLTGLFITAIYAVGSILAVGVEGGVVTTVLVVFVLSLIGLLPIVIAFIFIVIIILFLAKEISDRF